MVKLSKAESYLKYKNDIRLEKYLLMIKNVTHRKALTRFRLSCHPLMIEKGRHRNPPLERSERKCPFCEPDIEDELHFIVACPVYENLRRSLFRMCSNTSIHFESMSNEEKFIFILSNEDVNVVSQLGSFIFNSLKVRASKLG